MISFALNESLAGRYGGASSKQMVKKAFNFSVVSEALEARPEEPIETECSVVFSDSYTSSRLNKGYALRALQLLNAHPVLASTSGTLWRAVMAGEEKRPNGQMEVVIALWSAGMCEAR